MNQPASPRLWQMFYVSRSTATPQQLQPLLEQARQHNAAHGITGALAYSGGHFAQVLEGDQDALQALRQRIDADARHEQVRWLVDGPLAARRHAGWAMAWVEAPGADDVLQDVLAAPTLEPQRVQRLQERLFTGPAAA